MMRRLSTLFVLCALVNLPAHAACPREPQAIDLPAQPLDEALEQLAVQTGCTIEGKRELARLRASSVNGAYRPEEALWALLQGTGWEGYTTDEGLEVSKRQQRWVLKQTADLRARIEEHTALAPDTRRAYLEEIYAVERSAQALAFEQGFISAAEQASYRRSLSAIRDAL
ncbi:hypothetical protein [Halomonas sp. GD1P12]|uniref:hypothetical protein n=1 Tax=Halomonas sp. GD1P12 TaxID=2982691 RepID=UPI0021E4B59D|nr:hypothetical protein [Halomonas sp. GD1P12]UYF98681.1 hypothetical protein OCT39_10580 [Halomonas sp. GD1P12]